MEKTLGSLFDGIGGFPLAASRHGIKTIWASEIEPFPIKVTKIRLPDMQHLGDITKIDGTSIEPVDIVTFGSPCQDLSVAGKRAGLSGERSGLFMEAIRIIKEMRSTYEETSQPIRPRFAVWENVPGAFSSNKGEDFRAVLEEICRVKDETVTSPGPPKGKWSTVGAVMGNGYSVAWRILDAQYWGVPQRRRRIFLVADFGGHSAGEILFKREGLSRYSQESGEARKGITADAERSTDTPIWAFIGKNSAKTRSIGETENISPTIDTGGANVQIAYNTPKTMLIRCGKEGGGKGALIQDDKSATLSTLNTTDRHAVATKVYGIGAYNSEGMKSNNPHSGVYEANTSRTLDLNGGSPACNQGGMAIVQCIEPGALSRGQGERVWDKCPTLRANMGDNQPCVVLNDQGGSQMDVSNDVVGTLRAEMHGNIPAVTTYSFQRSDEFKETDKASTQSRRQYKDATDLVVSPTYALDRASFNQGKNAQYDFQISEDDKTQTVVSRGPNAVAEPPRYSVRRLTPLECERLQGFPDGWTDIPGQTEATEEELEFWREVWLTWDKTQAEDPEKVKPRTDNRLLRWLKNPVSDSAQYKALGNSVAIPCCEYVLEGISEILDREQEQ